MTNRPDHMEEIIKGVGELRKQWLSDFDQMVEGIPFGAKRLSDAQHSAWFAEMMQRYPPEPWISPEGQTVMMSPWLLALRYVEGGEKEARRYVASFRDELEAVNVHSV